MAITYSSHLAEYKQLIDHVRPQGRGPESPAPPAACRSVLEQDAEPQIAPHMAASAVNG